MIGTCPNCEKAIDLDGFFEHGQPTLFYCECGKIYEGGNHPLSSDLIELPIEDVDLSGLEEIYPIDESRYGPDSRMSRGLFICKTRLETYEMSKDEIKQMKARLADAENLLHDVNKHENWVIPKGPQGQDQYVGMPNLCRLIDGYFSKQSYGG